MASPSKTDRISGEEADEQESTSSTSPSNVFDFQKGVSKRLEAMTDRQDSIQALSLWMIHHKTDCQKIAACWLAAMKKAKVKRRLSLFYLANDVVQSCKKKNAKIYLLAFKNVLKDAVVLVRDASVKHKIERIFHIWEERNTYFADFIKELRELLNDREKVTAHVSAANFKPQAVIESIRKVKLLETHVAMKQKQVANLKLDASKIEAVKQLKDRSHSHEFARQFDDSYTKMHGYVKMLENEVEQRAKLIEVLENGQTFYEVQNDDALVVANAYRNFGIRINNLKKRLVDYKDTLTDEMESPIPSPSAEAPSPGCTPPQDSGESPEAMDMDFSDSEDAVAGKIIAAEPYIPSSSNSLTDRLAAMGNTLPVATADPRQAKAAGSNAYSPAEQLQREKSGTSVTEKTDHNFLFSMVAAKAQPTTGRQDKSVLKSLTEFAEKVKNPPPKDWSEFNKKRMERLEKEIAEHKAAQEALKKAELNQQTSLQHTASPEKMPHQQQLTEHTAPRQQHTEHTAPQQQLTEHTAPQQQILQRAKEKEPEEYVPSPVSSQSSSNYQASPVQIQSTTNYQPSPIENTSQQSLVESEADESAGLQSMSWPPRNSPILTSAQAIPAKPLAEASPPAQPNLISPPRPLFMIRPPMPSHIVINSTAQTMARNSTEPSRPLTRPMGNVVTVSSAPPPPPGPRVRTISSEQQEDALNLLDSIHAESTGQANGNDVSAQPTGQNQGIPIQTLGSNNTSPVINRTYPAMSRPPAPPYYNYRPPPAKRPYQQYGANYQYY